MPMVCSNDRRWQVLAGHLMCVGPVTSITHGHNVELSQRTLEWFAGHKFPDYGVDSVSFLALVGL
jgi:hypothetical protein